MPPLTSLRTLRLGRHLAPLGLALVTSARTRAVGVGVLVSGLVLPAVFLGINGIVAFG